jgi:transcriptional regulator GlxA family with amidase domain
MRTVTVLVFDDCSASSVTAFVDVFRIANQLWRRASHGSSDLFGWQLVSPNGKPVTTSSGIRFAVDGTLPNTASDVVYVPAIHYRSEEQLLRDVDRVSAGVCPWLTGQYRRGAVLAAGCSGAFVLGRAGLLDGKVVATSWWLHGLFRRQFPAARLRPDELVTVGDRLLCAGPVGAHGNLALRIVESTAGRDLALRCAKLLLIDPSRPSQRPYVVVQDQVGHTDELVLRAQDWMRRHLGDPISVTEVARAVGASQRSLNRRFRGACRSTPVGYLQNLRIEAAKNLLETTDLGLDAILDRIGYQDGATFRKLFREHTSLSPREYRQRFAIGRAARRAVAVSSETAASMS